MHIFFSVFSSLFLYVLIGTTAASPAPSPDPYSNSFLLPSLPGIYNSTLSTNNNATAIPSSSSGRLNSTTNALPKDVTCYNQGHRSPPVDLAMCFEIIATLASRKDYQKPTRWRTTRTQAINMKLGGCRLQIIDGAQSDAFSVEEIVDAMEAILLQCQPEVRAEYAGTGGQKGVGRWGFVVRVVGVVGWDGWGEE
ncbi:hypothetical protein ACLMJK_000750 [Lecanora helva]